MSIIAAALLSACVLNVPSTGCRLGTATVSTPYEEGATYSWNVVGATIVGGAGTNQIVLSLGDGRSALVQLNGTCEAVIGLHDPLVIKEITVPQDAVANQPVTVSWSYEGTAEPSSQLLTGEDFAEPVILEGNVRSFTWTPLSAGTKHIQLQASYTPAADVIPPAGGRRRAVAPVQGGTASTCPAEKSAELEVRGCLTPGVQLTSPDSVELGATFKAFAQAQGGETFHWEATGGRILSGEGTPQARVQADNFGTLLTLRVVVGSAGGCTTTVVHEVKLTPQAVCRNVAPTASLALERKSCARATVKATFTGTPPFRGTWSDHTLFETMSTTITHDFADPGTYTIDDFHDSFCYGKVIKTAHADSLYASAVLTTDTGSCTKGAVTATFSGTAPFRGVWSDGVQFSTNDTELVRASAGDGPLFIRELTDGACSVSARTPSNTIVIGEPPTASFRQPIYCDSASVVVDVTGDEGPYKVYFSDGIVAQTSAYYPHTVTRQFGTTKSPAQQVSIERVTSKSCTSEGPFPSSVATFRARPVFKYVEGDYLACNGIATASVDTTKLPPNAQFTWSISNGTVISGQGTSSARFALNAGASSGIVMVSVTYPDGVCNNLWSSTGRYYSQTGSLTEFTVTPSEIPVFGKAQVKVTWDNYVSWGSLSVTPTFRVKALGTRTAIDHGFVQTYQDGQGAGDVAITIEYRGPCTPPTRKTIPLKIVE